MKQYVFLVTLVAIIIAINLAGLIVGIATIAAHGLAQNATAGNTTDGNSTERLTPTEDSAYSEYGGWG